MRMVAWRKRVCKLVLSVSVCALVLQGAPEAAENNTWTGATPKYVFFFIGDGLADPQRHAAEIYKASSSAKPNDPSDLPEHTLVMNQFPVHGVNTTYASNSFITDSAAAGTALACGHKTDSGMISMLPDGTEVKSMATLAKAKGMKVGIISSVSIDHATPAVFYANNESRSNYYDIDKELAASGFDFFGGGGLRNKGGTKTDSSPDALDIVKEAGYTYVNTRDAFLALEKGAQEKVIFINPWLQDSDAMPYDMDRTPTDVSLAEITEKAIELLDNENGFFMMVEGGKIDWACHANDAAATIHDVIAFDDAVAKAVAFYNEHPTETLIVVTGDHETGGMSLGFANTPKDSGSKVGYTTYFYHLKEQTVSYQKFDADIWGDFKEEKGFDDVEGIIELVDQYFGLEIGGAGSGAMVTSDYENSMIVDAYVQAAAGDDAPETDETYIKYGTYDPFTVTLTHVLNQKAGIAWTSYSHTGVPLQTSAKGVGQELFEGYYDNTDIAKKLMSIMAVSE